MANERLGASFAIDTTSLKAGLAQANRLIRQSEAEFRASAAGIDNWNKSEEGLIKRQKALNEQIDIQKQKVSALTSEKQKIIEKMKQEGKSQEEIDRAIDSVNKQITNESKQLDKLKGELDKTNKGLEDLEEASEDAGDAVEDAGARAEKSSDGFTVMKGALANLVAEGFHKAIDAAKQFVTSMIEVGSSFDTAMSQVSAVSGATGDDLEKLRNKAKELGESTKFTASEAAEAFNYMAMAGWKTEDMLGGIEGILNLAAASGSDLATASDIVTDALTAMGYSASDAGRLADVMAAASSNANTNVEMMGATFKYAAPLVGAMGYSMEDTAVAIGLMANSGIKAEQAGTSLRSIMTRLATDAGATSKSLGALGTLTERLGVQFYNTDGTTRELSSVINETREAWKGLTAEEQASYGKIIAGQEAISGWLAIMNAAPEDVDKLTEAVQKSDGAAQDMANTMINNLGGDMTILQSQLEGVRLTMYEEFEPTLRKGIQSVQKWIGKTDWKSFAKKAKDALGTVIEYGKKLAKNTLPAIKVALKVVGDVVKFAIDNFKTLATVLGVGITVWKTYKAVMAISGTIRAVQGAVAGLSAATSVATAVQTGFNAAMAANPIGAVLTAVGLLVGGLAMLIASQEEATETTDLLSEKQREAVTAAQEAAEAYTETKTAAEEMASAQAANVDYVRDNLLPQLEEVMDANGKVKEGEEGRAQFILNELNNALGTEYKSLSDIVDANGKIKQSIYEVMEAKKAQIMLSAYEDSYADAIKNVSGAEQARATQAQEVALQQQKVAEATDAVREAEEALSEYYATGDYGNPYYATQVEEAKWALQEEKGMLEQKEKEYAESQTALFNYYKDIEDYQKASTLVAQGETAKAIEYLNNMGSGFKTAAGTAQLGAEDQKKVLEQQVVDTEVNAKLTEEAYKKGVSGVTKEMVATAKKQAEKAKSEFYNVGGNISKGISKGVEGETYTLNASMKKVINSALEAAREAAGIKSPSRLFKKIIGKNIGLGIASGIDDTASNVDKSVKSLVKNAATMLDAESISARVSGSSVGSEKESNGKTVNVYQTNNYSQAHSRLELYKSKQQTAAAVRLAIGGA